MNKLLLFLSFNIKYDDSLAYRRVILVSSILIFTVFIFLFFAALNTFILNHPIVSILDLAAAVLSLYALYHLKRYHNLQRAAILATLNLIFFFLAFIYVHGSSHFSLIWTIFLPIFSILTNGKKLGLYFSLVFYALLFTMSFIFIEEWSNGEWLLQDWLRLVFASSMLTFIMYMNESALEESDKKLIEIRKQEKKHIKELHKLSNTDQLTGLFNRRYYNETMPILMSLAKRKNYFVTFFILDLDSFKNYNDYYGHMKGDKTLIKVAQALKKHIQRDDDFVFRLGGEEFAGIVISDDKEKTHKHIMSICKVIEDLKIKHSKSEVSEYVTVSIGISTISHEKGYTMDNLYYFADEALYVAKDSGRNRSSINTQTI